MNMNCVLCNDIVTEGSKIEIYYTFTTHTKTLLINFIKKTLNCNLNKSHSKYICKECCNLFEELDFTESTYTALKKTIFQKWILNECDSLTKDAVCQTDNNFESDNTRFKEVRMDILSLESIKQENNENLTTEAIIAQTKKEHMAKIGKQKKSYMCQFCQKKFVTNHGMILHIQRKHQNGTPSSVANNSIHIGKSVKVECDVVVKEFSKSELDNGPDDDSSSTSSKSINNIKKIKAKKKIGTVVKPLKYACPHCPKMWRTTGELRNHVASHSNLRPYICEVCGQAYKHKTALNIHVGMHNGINPFSCKYCQKSFTQKGALQRHLPIHTGEAPYQCDLCGKRFVHHTSFNMHTLAHTGQKSYKCTICGLALLSGSHLKRHMRVHTGERPYACVQCGKRFAERYNLAAHQRLHEAGPSELSKRSYRCQVCGAGFDRRPKLEEHLSNNHNKISENDPSRKWVGHFLGNM